MLIGWRGGGMDASIDPGILLGPFSSSCVFGFSADCPSPTGTYRPQAQRGDREKSSNTNYTYLVTGGLPWKLPVFRPLPGTNTPFCLASHG
jgi:hypothetical protein